MNAVQLIGRLGADPVVRFTPSGVAVTNFSIAVDEFAGGEKKAVWIACTAWKQSAEVLRDHAVKGQRVAIEGRLSVKDWEDSQQQKRHEQFVTVERVTLLDKPSSEKAAPATPGQAEVKPQSYAVRVECDPEHRSDFRKADRDHADDVPF